MKLNKVLPSFLIGILAACTVGPDYTRPEPFSDAALSANSGFAGSSRAEVSKYWYKQFNDKTLDKLIAMGLSSAPNVQIATHRLRAARYNLKSVQMQNFPMLDANGGYTYSKGSRDIGFNIDRDYFQTGLDAVWELDIWGAGRRSEEAAGALFQAAGAELDNVRLVLISEIANNYVSLRTIQEQKRIATDNLEMQQEIANIVKQKHDNGLTDDIALNQAQYAVASTQAYIPALKQQEEAYINSLSTLLGILPDSLQNDLRPVSKNLIRRRFKYNLEGLYDLPVSIIRNRPDVRISEQQLIAQNAEVGVAVAGLYPNVSIQGFIGYQGANIPHLMNPRTYTYNYSPSVMLPLFHWGRLMNTVHQQEELKEVNIQQYKIALLSAVGDIRNSVEAMRQEQQKNGAYLKSVLTQKKIMRYSLERYRNGLMEFSDILTAEQNLLEAQKNLADSNGTMYQNLIAFYKSIGGGWQSEFNICQKLPSLNGTP